jgi:hypothetical protein
MENLDLHYSQLGTVTWDTPATVTPAGSDGR